MKKQKTHWGKMKSDMEINKSTIQEIVNNDTAMICGHHLQPVPNPRPRKGSREHH